MVARVFKRRSDMHLPRKLWHISGVLIMVLIQQRINRETAVTLLLATMLVFVVPDVIRQFSSRLNELFVGLFQTIIRESEVDKLSGNTYLLTGVLLTVLIFPQKVVTLALLFLAFADPIASCIGILYGKDKIWGNKSLQGFMAAFFVCSVLTGGFLYVHNLLMDRVLVVSLLAGFIGAFSELIPVGKLDDNLTLPVMSATGLYLLLMLFGASL